MNYSSTRGNATASPAQCLVKGIAGDGGLFVPEAFPQFSLADIAAMGDCSYAERAHTVLSVFLDDFTSEELWKCVDAAYNSGAFNCRERAPLFRLTASEHMLELWHGPTFAFKDMALQLLPHLLSVAKEKTGIKEDIMILVATSGDTGKAALEGFCDVPGVRIAVFYPNQGVAEMQRLQMVTQRGNNVTVGAINGNFDDAQTAVKKLFADKNFNQLLLDRGVRLSSANSINWGRLVPQIAYYFSAYTDIIKSGSAELGDKINFVVPTGNFGDILAGYYAKKMGLPINKLICASNSNNVLTDFLTTGRYSTRREFIKTASPSMDILISSNLERLLYDVSGDAEYCENLMKSLRETGEYTLDPVLLKKIRESFDCGWASEERTAQAIHDIYEKYGYIIDPHTAVAQAVLEDYRARTGDNTRTVTVSTASPFKFPHAVLKAITGEDADEFDAAVRLEELGAEQPDGLKYLAMRPVLHDLVCEKDELAGIILASTLSE